MWGHASHLILMDWIMKKCIVIVGWHYSKCEDGMYTLDKKARNKGTQLQHRNRLLYTKDKKKAGEIKRRDETREERRPDKRNERIKNTKKIVYFSSLVCCSHFALARE